jgi:hypothetical protein
MRAESMITVDDYEREEEGAHPAGVWRVLAILAVAACFAWIPYVVPGLEKLRPLGPADDLPLSSLLGRTPRASAGELTGARRRDALIAQDDDALLETAPLPEPIDVRPSAPRPGGGDRQQAPLARIDPSEYEGLTREIEDPDGSMRAFYRQLAEVMRDRPVLARMGVYSTSMNGSDRMTEQLRRLLQERFGGGGKGWVPVAPGWRYQHHEDVDWSAHGWRTYVVNRGNGPLDRYGFGGVIAESRAGARASIGTVDEGPGSAVGRFRVFYQAWPRGGSFAIRVDDGEPRTISTHADRVEDRVEEIDVPDGAHTLTLRAAGERPRGLRMYGVVMEREGPGVVVDGLALIGAFKRVLGNFDDQHLTTQIRQRDPNLLAFWMGANDAAVDSMGFSHDRYVERYREILRRFSDARPDTSCLVMSIIDKGVRVNGVIRTRPRVEPLVDAQREAARAEHCAFFNTYEAVGGAGTMRRWYHASPRLVTADLGHLTNAGSRVIGTLLYRALLKGFDDWIAEGAPAPHE